MEGGREGGRESSPHLISNEGNYLRKAVCLSEGGSAASCKGKRRASAPYIIISSNKHTCFYSRYSSPFCRQECRVRRASSWMTEYSEASNSRSTGSPAPVRHRRGQPSHQYYPGPLSPPCPPPTFVW